MNFRPILLHMKKINLKSPRYVLPLICLPFILLLYYVYRSQARPKQKDATASGDSLRSDVSTASIEVQGQKLQNKLQAFQDRYPKGDGYTAVGDLSADQPPADAATAAYSKSEKQLLDSIESSIKSRYDQTDAGHLNKRRGPPGTWVMKAGRSLSQEDRAMEAALRAMDRPQAAKDLAPAIRQEDPMVVFRAQMAIVDSIGKANDPARRAQLLQEKKRESSSLNPAENKLSVSLLPKEISGFNTVRPASSAPVYIPAIIDQGLAGYAGSRVRLRLLEDIWAGKFPIKKGSYLYGTISAFSAQRIQISISSVRSSSGILPVHLEVYDLDGLKGLYVPASAFRELTRELGSSSLQGISLDAQGEGKEQLMSLLGRVFQSSSGAFTRLVRQNKARIKYATLVYLIDPNELK